MDRTTGKPCAGTDHLAQSIGDILSTPIGHRVGRRDYGSDLPELLDQPANPRTRLLVFAATATAIQRQEGRVRLTRVALQLGTAPGAFILRLIGTRLDAPDGARPLDLSVSVRALSALS
jgi:phage baseplate assembly protein W